MTDVGDKTDQDRRVCCPCCGGSCLPPPDEFANGTRCPWCSGRGWVSLADALLWLRSMANGDAAADRIACPACRGTTEPSPLDVARAGPYVGGLSHCTACAGTGRVTTAQAVAILERMPIPEATQ